MNVAATSLRKFDFSQVFGFSASPGDRGSPRLQCVGGFFRAERRRLVVEWVVVGLELGVALVIALAVYLTLKK